MGEKGEAAGALWPGGAGPGAPQLRVPAAGGAVVQRIPRPARSAAAAGKQTRRVGPAAAAVKPEISSCRAKPLLCGPSTANLLSLFCRTPLQQNDDKYQELTRCNYSILAEFTV